MVHGHGLLRLKVDRVLLVGILLLLQVLVVVLVVVLLLLLLLLLLPVGGYGGGRSGGTGRPGLLLLGVLRVRVRVRGVMPTPWRVRGVAVHPSTCLQPRGMARVSL